jgi:hypothetical protein
VGRQKLRKPKQRETQRTLTAVKTYPTAVYSNSRCNLGSNISTDAGNSRDTNNRVVSNFQGQEASNVVVL